MGKTRVEVIVDHDLERALRAFRSKTRKERIMEELKRKRFFVKPSETRRKEALRIKRKYHKRERDRTA